MGFGEMETKMKVLNMVVAGRYEEVPGRLKAHGMHVVSAG